MSAGAVGAAPAVCKEAGCGKPVIARGMCDKHRKRWAKQNPEIRTMHATMKAVKDSLPGTREQLAKATGLHPETIRFTLPKLKTEGLAHIGYFDPPTTKGTHWTEVWEAGPGKDAAVTECMRLAQRRKGQRELYARRQAGKAGWLGAMGIKSLGAR